jgi:transposase InsO family protein
MKPKENKTTQAKALGVSRSLLYYQHKQPAKDWALKCQIEKILRTHPSYGHKRLAIELGINKKRTLRVMKLFSLHPYRRRGKRWKKPKKKEKEPPCANLLLEIVPQYPHHIWVSDFTELKFHGKLIYVATVMDLYTRQIVGFSILLNHSVHLVIGALLLAVSKYARPQIIHSDQGSAYKSKDYRLLLNRLGIQQSMSAAGCPWENGYQESFYSQFKVDLGDPNRFEKLGELIYEIYKTIHTYNHSRIHTALRMSPVLFANQFNLLLMREKVS